MDFVRSCYFSYMRLYPDRPDVLVRGSWHFCEPGARVIPFPHAFGSQIWDAKGQDGDPRIGEVRGFDGYSKGAAVPRFVGQHFCGSPAVWSNGIPYANRPGLTIEPDGTPTCCHAPRASVTEPTGGDLAIDESGTGGDVFSGAKATAYGQSIDARALTVIPWDHVEWDTDNYFDLAGNPSIGTAPFDGVYLISASAYSGGLLTNSDPTFFQVYLDWPAFDGKLEQSVNNGGDSTDDNPTLGFSAEIHLYAGDTFTFNVYWDRLGSDSAFFSPQLSIQWMGNPPYNPPSPPPPAAPALIFHVPGNSMYLSLGIP